MEKKLLFDKINMLVSLNVKMAIIRLTCHPEMMISVLERTGVSPVILARVPGKSQALFFTFLRQHSPCPD